MSPVLKIDPRTERAERFPAPCRVIELGLKILKILISDLLEKVLSRKNGIHFTMDWFPISALLVRDP